MGLKAGDIIFVKTNSIISWAIRKITKSKYSHCALICSDNFLIESDFLKSVGVRKNKYTDFKIVSLNITDKERLDLITYCLENTGKKYNYKRIIGILLLILGLTKNRNLWSKYNEFICCELLVRDLTILNSQNIPREIIDSITPDDLANILLKEQVINQT